MTPGHRAFIGYRDAFVGPFCAPENVKQWDDLSGREQKAWEAAARAAAGEKGGE